MSEKQNKSGRNFLPFVVGGMLVLVGAFCMGTFGGILAVRLLPMGGLNDVFKNSAQIDVNVVGENSAIIDVAESTSPAVVSIVITKDLPVYERYFVSPFGDDFFQIPRRRQVGSEEQQVGAGTGFVVTKEGMIITNKHVVSDTDADYTVVFTDNTRLPATVVDRDDILDIAILKVEPKSDLKFVSLGDSDAIKIGQNVIAIGNSLGRFSNTVSSGIISGLARSIVASDGSTRAEQLDGVIQTDASINPGNSGGPLLDIAGNVIGVNVAIADGENIGFAIPINLVKPVINSVIKYGEIKRGLLGVRYVTITPTIATEQKLTSEYGALLQKTDAGLPAVAPGSSAQKAGLQEGDIILAINGVELKNNTTLQLEILKYNLSEAVSVRYKRGSVENTVDIVLTEIKD